MDFVDCSKKKMFFFFFSNLKSLMKNIHFYREKKHHKYQLLATLILVACYINSVSHFSTIQLRFINLQILRDISYVLLISDLLFTSYRSVYIRHHICMY
jgi:hypothetical protein